MSWLTERLATRMREREVTVDALARQLAVERSRLSAIIAGGALPNGNLTRRLARAFGEDPNEWLAQATRPAADEQTAEIPIGFVKVAAVAEIPDGEMKSSARVRLWWRMSKAASTRSAIFVRTAKVRLARVFSMG